VQAFLAVLLCVCVRGRMVCSLVAGGWFVVREKYCWLVADKPSEHGVGGTRRTGSVQSVYVYM
jgi:hypothetical protein